MCCSFFRSERSTKAKYFASVALVKFAVHTSRCLFYLQKLKWFWLQNWTSPATCQGWSNYNFGKDNIVSFKIKKPVYKFYCPDFIQEDISALQKMKVQTYSSIQPTKIDSRLCTVILLSNLLEPQWVSVNCSDDLLPNRVCTQDSRHKEILNVSKTDTVAENFRKSCLQTETQVTYDICAILTWYQPGIVKSPLHVKTQSVGTLVSITRLIFATNVLNFSFIFAEQPTNADTKNLKEGFQLKQFTFHREIIYNTFQNRTNVIKSNTIGPGSKYLSLRCTKSIYRISDLVWHCQNGSQVKLEMVKDSYETLFFRSSKYVCEEQNQNWWLISGGHVISCNCSEIFNFSRLFHTNQFGACKSFLPDEKQNKRNNDEQTSQPKQIYKCQDGHQIDMSQKDDLVSDCGTHADDEYLYQGVLRRHIAVPCSDPQEMPCHLGHPKCYKLKHICLYRLDHLGNIFPCRTGAHLQSCLGVFCPTHYYKCHQAYCVPWSYICDNKWDCTFGDDEWGPSNCSRNCINKLRCKTIQDLQICVSMISICDGFHDCPDHDDEFMCIVSPFKCPVGCMCFHSAISCFNAYIQVAVFDRSQNLYFLSYHIIDSNLTLGLKVILQSSTVRVNLTKNLISDPYLGCNCNDCDVRHIILSHNNILSVEKQAFCGLSELQLIDLGSNAIQKLHKVAFSKLTNLLKVNFENNDLQTLPQGLFHHTPKLSILNIQGNPLSYLDMNIFSGLSIKFIFTHKYQICCIRPPDSVCNVLIPWHVSCTSLFPNVPEKVTFILVSLVVVLLSTAISVRNSEMMYTHYSKGKLQRKLDKSAGPFNIFLSTNFMADCLWGIYLLIIWSADTHYGAEFSVKDAQWTQSIICYFALTISFFVSLFLPCLQFIIGFARLMVVKYPFDSEFKKTSFVLKTNFLIVITCISLTTATIVPFLRLHSIPTALCILFVDPTNSIVFLKVLTTMIASVQLLCAFTILITHISLVVEAQSSSVSSTSKKSVSNSMIAQLICLTASNFLCWVAPGIIFVVCSFAEQYSTELIVWIIVLAVPMNSFVYPIVVLITLK